MRVQQYPALSGLGVKLGDHLNPGRWPGLRYFAPLGLRRRLRHGETRISPFQGWGSKLGDESKPQAVRPGLRYFAPLGLNSQAKAWVNGTQTDTRALKGRNNPFQSHTYRSS